MSGTRALLTRWAVAAAIAATVLAVAFVSPAIAHPLAQGARSVRQVAHSGPTMWSM